MKTNTESLRSALEALEKLDALKLVAEFRAFEHGCGAGSYCALRLDPASGETRLANDPSWCCSADEYFGESGILSDCTLISSTRAHWSPSPDDGFEWDFEGEDYLWDGKNHDSWIPIDSDKVADRAEKLLREKLAGAAEAILPEALEGENALQFLLASGWESFGISATPVDGWVPDGEDDEQVISLSKELADLRAVIAGEIDPH